MILGDSVSAIIIASFVAFAVVAQVARVRAVVMRGPSVRRTRGFAESATYFFWVPYAVVWARPGPSIVFPEPLVWLGLACSVLGVVFAVAAIATLGRHYDLKLELHAGHELVRRGPYAVVRHPVYTGLGLHTIGACLATGNVVFILGSICVTLPVFVLRARAEEALLRAEFGAEYERYAREVAMLIPGVI